MQEELATNILNGPQITSIYYLTPCITEHLIEKVMNRVLKAPNVKRAYAFGSVCTDDFNVFRRDEGEVRGAVVKELEKKTG